VSRKAHGGQDFFIQNNGGDLGFEGLGNPFDGPLQCG